MRPASIQNEAPLDGDLVAQSNIASPNGCQRMKRWSLN